MSRPKDKKLALLFDKWIVAPPAIGPLRDAFQAGLNNRRFIGHKNSPAHAAFRAGRDTAKQNERT